MKFFLLFIRIWNFWFHFSSPYKALKIDIISDMSHQMHVNLFVNVTGNQYINQII